MKEIKTATSSNSNEDLPDGWARYSIDQVFDYVNTTSFSRENLTYDPTKTEIYYIHYGDIHSTFKSEILDFDKEKRVPFLKDKFSNGNFNYLKDGDLVIADASEDYTGVGECIEVKNIGAKKVIGGLHTIVLRGKSNLTVPGFNTYIFKNAGVRIDLKRIATGISVYSLSKGNISKLKILLPPIDKQKIAATILALMDENIDKINQLICKKELQKKVLLQQLLTGKKRFKGFGEKWKIKKLDDCLTYTPREVQKPNSNFFALGIRSHGKGIFHKNDFDPEDIAMDILYEVKENDLIVNITFAWEHAIAIAHIEDNGGLVSHRFPTYEFKTESAIPDFFKYLILQKKFKYQLELISPGGAGRNRVMSKKDFPKIEVFIPEVEEQKAIASVLDCATKEIQLLKAKADKLKEQKKGMMQLLLTGKKRLKIN
jgi:type I restriction enzyme S subunit